MLWPVSHAQGQSAPWPSVCVTLTNALKVAVPSAVAVGTVASVRHVRFGGDCVQVLNIA
jgi:hypothetical protein